MADSRQVTGGRDDLVVDVSRCLRMRFSESGCRRCIEICPHGAVALDGGLSINQEQCRGCLLCTAVCPVGAIEQAGDFSVFLSQLSRVPKPVLGCSRAKEQANATMACLGGLSEEHLLALCHSLSGELTLNITPCGDCPNGAMIPRLRQHLADLSGAALLDGGCRIILAESAADIHFSDVSVDRRSFFKSLRSSLFQSAAVILSVNSEPVVLRTDYTAKRLPFRRELLKRTIARLPAEARINILGRFQHHIAMSDSCSACHGCVAICPTGALLTDSPDDRTRFDAERCTGCGLCVEFCFECALRLDSSALCDKTVPE